MLMLTHIDITIAQRFWDTVKVIREYTKIDKHVCQQPYVCILHMQTQCKQYSPNMLCFLVSDLCFGIQ